MFNKPLSNTGDTVTPWSIQLVDTVPLMAC